MQRQLKSPRKQNAAAGIKYCVKLLHYHTYSMHAYFFFLKDARDVEPVISELIDF